MTKKGKMAKLSVALVTALVMALCAFSTLLAACGKTTVTLDKTEAALYVGDAVRITATVSGDEEAEIEWSTSDNKVATVRRGTVSAVGVGTAVITAALENGASATCTVTVQDRTVTISQSTATINLDETETLTLTATSSDNGAITWSSSDPAVAEVADGVVTAKDVGTAVITAQRGQAEATCEITVTQPSRPADYYKITKLTNVDVVADPGVWHYHADGTQGGDYDFEKEPLHANGTASVTLNVIPNVINSKFFYFRYQPDQVELEHYYTMKLAITVSESATLRLGSKGADNKFAGLMEEFVAGTEKEVEYVGYRNAAEPFSVRIDSEVAAEKVALSVKLISVVAHDGTELPEYHFHEEEAPKNYEQIPNATGEYELEEKNNAGTVQEPGTWYYWHGDSSVSEVKYNNGAINYSFDTLKTNGNQQLRFRPADLEGNVNIKVELNVTGNAAAKITLALCDSKTFKSSGAVTLTLAADGTISFSSEFTLTPDQLIFLEIRAADEDKTDASFTFSDIKIYKEIVE